MKALNSNTGKRDNWYKNLDRNTLNAFRYGDTITNVMAAEFLSDLREVEDWGWGVGRRERRDHLVRVAGGE